MSGPGERSEPSSERALVYGRADLDEGFDVEGLGPWERAHLEAAQSERRRREFAAGRLAARRALAALLGTSQLEGVSIERHADGAPLLVLPEGHPPVALSITHARLRAIALVSLGADPVGLDLTDAEDAARIRRIARRAFPKDAERALALATDASACAAWALKEAVAKTLRIGMLEGGGVGRIEVRSLAPPQVLVADDPRGAQLRLRVEAGHDGGVLVSAWVQVGPA